MITAPRVLISDDEPPLVRSLSRLFRREGVETLEDGSSDVVELAMAERPQLILLDRHQKRDGLDLLRELKGDLRTAAIRVVMMSGDVSDADRREAKRLGAEDFLAKPFDSEVVAALARSLSR